MLIALSKKLLIIMSLGVILCALFGTHPVQKIAYSLVHLIGQGAVFILHSLHLWG